MSDEETTGELPEDAEVVRVWLRSEDLRNEERDLFGYELRSSGEECAKIAETMSTLSQSNPAQVVAGEGLAALLHRVFGHSEFRAHQQEVCAAATAGRDVLLVMPTGAGKSLCYQLPALARGGTALVVSPLIALMDDQATKLSALGLRVARIHSGMGRDSSRQACRDYLAGDLDFLFIAPERMRVPGFPEMLAKRKPVLVAIDEAHCISAWGHDFRPDYRTLGQYLPALRPAPIIALTATATPTVQRDILKQLDLREPAVFITGFRRQNLAVEVVELSKPQRAEFALKLLRDTGARPAIVYAGSRKQAEEFAGALHQHFPTAAYHAGLDAGTRDRVQRAFLGGKLECVVATVAFGMGVDKADVRTVVHVALPGSIEAYYQEIGRAGRDGLPSRTVLLHGFADRRLQEFFLEKSYPPSSELATVAALLGDAFVGVESLVKPSRLDRETLDTVIEKLLATGVAVMDMAGDVRLAPGQSSAGWKDGYEAQVASRRAQIDRMVGFAEANECRMRMLVQHFGDTSDTARSCGLCDVCNPAGSGSANAAHQPSAQERGQLRTILRALEGRSTSTGKLFTELALMKERKDFDVLLDALARAGLITLANDTFRSPEGKDITYKKASITHEGREPDEKTLDTVWIRGNVSAAPAKKKAKARAAAAAERVAMNPDAEDLFERLRAWRTEVAKPTKTPAFMILADAVLRGIAARGPKTLAELHSISGMGPAKVERYGAAVLAVCRGEAGAAVGSSAPSGSKAPFVAERNMDGLKPVPFKATTEKAPILPVRSESKPAWAGTSVPAQQVRRDSASDGTELSEEQRLVEERLKQWRRVEAVQAGLPSFLVLSDTALREIVSAAPRTVEELRAVRGVGAEKVERFGEVVVGLCRSEKSIPLG